MTTAAPAMSPSAIAYGRKPCIQASTSGRVSAGAAGCPWPVAVKAAADRNAKATAVRMEAALWTYSVGLSNLQCRSWAVKESAVISPRLSRENIVAVAIEMADEEGLASVTLRG